MLLACLASVARADAGWFDSGDTQLRMDLQLLNDAEVIRYPVNQWPVPRAGVQYALANAKDFSVTNSAVAAALERVRARAAVSTHGRPVFDTGVRGGKPGLWRDFDTLAREDGELGGGMAWDSGRYAVDLELTAVADPDDGHTLRADGSHATVQWGNWLVSANELDRWWGPGHEGSLILSNNARPMPTLMVERAEAQPWQTKWLSWLGPWRMNFALSRMEDQRQDIDAPMFMAWRFVFMPFKKIELGFSRTAQFCGEQLKCDLSVIGNMLIGHDNVGINTTKADEPGNQMAGFDIRWNSPIGNLPYALYAQYIGEDVSSYLPVKYLPQLGLEIWKPTVKGGLLQGFFEYSSTSCSALADRGSYFLCAYNQGRFNVEGYRYYHRSVGYTADRDAENWAVGANFSAYDGQVWTATARTSRFSSGSHYDPLNTVAIVPTDYVALELGWKGRFRGERISIDLGVQSTEPVFHDVPFYDPGTRDTKVFGFIGWQHEFQP